MKDEMFKVLKKNDLLEKYVKAVFLIEFYASAWLRWMTLVENAAESVDILDGIIDSCDGFESDLLEEYKDYYEEAYEALSVKTTLINEKINAAEDRKAILFAEICRRNLSYEISRYQEIIERRTIYYHKCVEGDV